MLILRSKIDQLAYMSEIAGLYRLIMVVELIKDMWALKLGSVTLGYDEINTFYEVLDWKYRATTSNQQQFDLLSGIQGYIRDSSVTYVPKHVKGHQDDWVDINNLNRLVLSNIEVIYWDKEFWEAKVGEHRYFLYTNPKGMRKVSMLGYRVCSHLVKYLRESIEGTKVAEFWIYKRKKMSEQRYLQVD